MKRAVIYCRASLDISGERESVERQEAACRGLCTARGWDVVTVYVDNSISGYSDDKKRPGWEAVLERVRRGEVDVIVAWHLDRVTRSMTALEQLILLTQDQGVGVATATGDIDLTNDTGRMVARILAAVARAEVERKAARQTLANNARALQGRPFTGGPRAFGYAADGMELVQAEVDAFRWAAQAALDGLTMRAIAAELVARGCSSTRAAHSSTGAGWTGGGVRKMLVSPRYAGIRVHKGIEVGPGEWQPLIDLETHVALKRVLLDPTRDPRSGELGRNSHKPTNLLSLIAKCGRCGDTLIASARRGDPRYTCRSGKGCVWPSREGLDVSATEAVLGLLSTPGFLASLVPANDERAASAQREIDKLQRRLSLVNDDFNDGVYDDDEAEYQRITRDIRAKINAQKALLAELGETRVFDGLAVGTEQVVDQWETLAMDARRAIIGRLLEVTALPTAGARWDVERHVQIRRNRRLASVA